MEHEKLSEDVTSSIFYFEMIQLRDILYQLDIKSLFEVIFLILITIKVCTQKLRRDVAAVSQQVTV